MATEMGFTHIQAATNGILMANSLEFAEKCKEAGLHTLYLQFDGMSDDVYLKTRGEALLDKKMQVIENCRKAGMKIVFVPTIVKGINDHQLGDILHVRHRQHRHRQRHQLPARRFTGRINRRELEAEALHAVRPGARSWRSRPASSTPITTGSRSPAVTPFSKLISALEGRPRADHLRAPALLHGHLPVRG